MLSTISFKFGTSESLIERILINKFFCISFRKNSASFVYSVFCNVSIFMKLFLSLISPRKNST